MVRSALGKAAWVGRTASMVFGLALVVALVFGAVSVGLAANAVGSSEVANGSLDVADVTEF